MDHDQIYREKMGFGSPAHVWHEKKGAYADLYNSFMESDKFKNRDFIEHSHFNPIFESHKIGKYREKNCAFLWTYLNLEMWYRIFFEDGWKKLI